ncbi:MAG: cation diffusion facilitator family transporter [Chloroflexi bacterium]|nr:cation diffusion facilitator family transporter [Chloroflexota bacterium]
MFSTRTSAAGLSILSNSLLVALKLTVGIIMGSVSVISEGVHSTVDLIAAMIAFFSIRAAAKPADEEHEFGHGKIENISGTIEALLIFLAAILIIYEAIVKIINRAQPEFITLGIGIMAFSAVANFFVSRRLHRIAHSTDSIALEADAWHLTTDVYTSLGVFAGLIVVEITHWYILDPIIAIGVALLIIRAAWNITRKSISGLVDVRLPEEEEDIITASITEHLGEITGFHELRTRKAGSQRYIDLHLVLPKSVTLEEAHRLCDHLEGDIKNKLSNGLVTIHCEPCEQGEDGSCPPECPVINCSIHVGKGGPGQTQHTSRSVRPNTPRLLRQRRFRKQA